MEAWMIVTVLILLALVGFYIFHLVSEYRSKRFENDEFFDKANEAMGLKYTPDSAFDEKKRQVFDQYKSEKKWDEERFTEDEPPEDSWQRELPAREVAILKAALVKRALTLIPTLNPFQQEVNSKFNLLQRGLISEKAWDCTLKFRNVINKEVMSIRHEAECLQPDFGFSGLVFKEAQTFFDHDMKKKQAEMLKLKFMQSAIAQGLSQEDAIKFVNAQMARVMAGGPPAAKNQQQTDHPSSRPDPCRPDSSRPSSREPLSSREPQSIPSSIAAMPEETAAEEMPDETGMPEEEPVTMKTSEGKTSEGRQRRKGGSKKKSKRFR